jgi:hypothetical protein
MAFDLGAMEAEINAGAQRDLAMGGGLNRFLAAQATPYDFESGATSDMLRLGAGVRTAEESTRTGAAPLVPTFYDDTFTDLSQVQQGAQFKGGEGPYNTGSDAGWGSLVGAGMSGLGSAIGPSVGNWMSNSAIFGPNIGSAVGGFLTGFCWVADELFGVGSDKAMAARRWCLANLDHPVVREYAERGPEWVQVLRDQPELVESFRPVWERMAEQGGA